MNECNQLSIPRRILVFVQKLDDAFDHVTSTRSVVSGVVVLVEYLHYLIVYFSYIVVLFGTQSKHLIAIHQLHNSGI